MRVHDMLNGKFFTERPFYNKISRFLSKSLVHAFRDFPEQTNGKKSFAVIEKNVFPVSRLKSVPFARFVGQGVLKRIGRARRFRREEFPFIHLGSVSHYLSGNFKVFPG